MSASVPVSPLHDIIIPSAFSHTMNSNPSSSKHKRRYHRYCNHCGWGFSRHAWLESTFCSYCGQQLAKVSHGAVHGDARPAKRGRRPGKSYLPETADVEVIVMPTRRSTSRQGLSPRSATPAAGSWTVEAPAPHGSGLSDKVSKGISLVQQHPYTSAVAGVATGAACIAGGGVIATVGAELVALGVGITTGATILGLLTLVGGVIQRDERAVGGGLVVAFAGAVIGTAVSLIGGIISAAGVALGVGGTVLISVSALVALARTSQLAWEHREQIKQLLHQARKCLPGASQVQLAIVPSCPAAMEGMPVMSANIPRCASKASKRKD